MLSLSASPLKRAFFNELRGKSNIFSPLEGGASQPLPWFLITKGGYRPEGGKRVHWFFCLCPPPFFKAFFN